MSQRITIEIKDKIATFLTELPVVCGNSDYVVDFIFDEEWNGHDVKTALFVVGGKAIEQVFTGNVCKMPVIQNTLIAWVGVFAGTVNDGTLATSTPALVKCIPCITDGDNVPAPPPEDVYNQIIQMINDGILKGDKGEKGEKGEKGDAGSIKFIPVATLPTENIDTTAIYLVPVDNGEEENRCAEYVYIDGEWEKLGEIPVQFDHSEYVKFTNIAREKALGVVQVAPGYGVLIGGQGTLYTESANASDIESKTHNYRVIVPSNLDHAVKVGITTNTKTLTDEEKVSACKWLGAVTEDENVVRKQELDSAIDGCVKAVIPSERNVYYFPALIVNDYAEVSYWSIKGTPEPSGEKVIIRSKQGRAQIQDPVEEMDITNKRYVDSAIAAAITGALEGDY